jgi:hypothetical protein
MSANAQAGSAPQDPGDQDSGLCAFCAAPNPREKIACHFCGSRLPWTFEATGRLTFESRVYLNSLRKDERDENRCIDSNKSSVSKPAPLPPDLIDTTVLKPAATPPVGKEVL